MYGRQPLLFYPVLHATREVSSDTLHRAELIESQQNDPVAAEALFREEFASTRSAGEIQRDLARKGEGIGMADSLISGVCLEHEAILLTRNHKRYERVPGLRLGFQFR